MPEISVVIPAFNAESTIRETIESVQQQTFPDFEIIVINDGSTDRTIEIVQSISDDRVKVFSYENGGLPTARNRGISQAKGEFIAFLDADDLWTPDKLERQLAALKQHPKAGVAYSWTCFMDVDERGEPAFFYPSSHYSYEGNVYEKLLVSDFIHNGSNTLVRRQAIQATGEFDSACPGCADWDYWLRLSIHWPFVVVPKHQILYRRAPGAMSSKVEVMKQAAIIAVEKAYQSAPPELQCLKSHTLVNFHKYCAQLYLQHRTDISGVSQAVQHLWSAIRLKPQTLLDKTTQTLALKSLVKLALPHRITNYLLQLNRKRRVSRDPRFQG